MYDFRFVDLSLRSLDFGWEIDAAYGLKACNPNLRSTAQLSRTLFEEYRKIIPISPIKERYKQILKMNI